MTRIRIWFVILLILVFVNTIHSQQKNHEINEWKHNVRYSQFLGMDLSSIFFRKECSYVGVFGKNFQKIYMRFDTVERKTNQHYSVKGESMLKSVKCLFDGTLDIDQIELLLIEHNRLYLVAVGDYEFRENNKNGIFKGSFRKYFVYSINENKLQFLDGYTEFGDMGGWLGIWTQQKTGAEYDCLFGFDRLPPSWGNDFDDGGGEPIINPKYKNYGWESHFDSEHSNLGFYLPMDCDNKWWLKEK